MREIRDGEREEGVKGREGREKGEKGERRERLCVTGTRRNV